jgi:PTS system mannose-specific IIC component
MGILMALRFLLAALLGGICYLDRTAGPQVMLHRPLIAGSIAGAIFGDFFAGATAGAILELLYIARLPVGASIPPDDTGAAIFAGAGAATAATAVGSEIHYAVLAALLLLSVPCAETGKVADRFVRRINGRIAHLTIDAVDRGDVAAVDHGLVAGFTLFAAVGVGMSLLFAGLGVAAGHWIPAVLSPGEGAGFARMFPLLPLLGAASVLSCTRSERSAVAFYVSMAAAFAVVLAWRWWMR